MKNIQKFEIGQSYQMTFIGDSELRPEFLCTKRTAKTVTFKGKHEVLTKKIRFDNDQHEYVVAGSYSMAPTISSYRKIQ
jgi:hypothetical protein